MSSKRNYHAMQHKYDRIVLLVDMDCFYCQVEQKLDPSLKGQPLAVVQYNAWRGGGIIAVNYAARAKGVTRHMRGDEAKAQCPEIVLAKVPNVREKADLTKYREAGKDVANVLQRFTDILERASVDEAYLDITESVNKRLVDMNEAKYVIQPEQLFNTYAVGYGHIGEFINLITSRLVNRDADDESLNFAYDPADVRAVKQSDIRLLIGASIASEIRAAVKEETGFECSAGIAHNKILAKLACGINKPNKQTILPLSEIPGLFANLPVRKITGLGAKFGEEVCERMGVRFLGELIKFSEADLQKKFDEKNGTWLYNICRGIDLEAVTPKFYSKSIGCCKKFPGRNNITGIKTLKHWLGELANEISDRLEKDRLENNRRARQMVLSYVQEYESEEISSSRSSAINSYEAEKLAEQCLDLLRANTKQFLRAGSEAVLNNPIKFLGISAGKFEPIVAGQSRLQEMFANQKTKTKESTTKGGRESPSTFEQNPNVENTSSINSKSVKAVEGPMKAFLMKSTQNKQQPNVSNASEAIKVGEPHKSEAKEAPSKKESTNIKSFFLSALTGQESKKEAVKSSDHLEAEKKDQRGEQEELETERLAITQPQKGPGKIIAPKDKTDEIPRIKSFFLSALKEDATAGSKIKMIIEETQDLQRELNVSEPGTTHEAMLIEDAEQEEEQDVLLVDNAEEDVLKLEAELQAIESMSADSNDIQHESSATQLPSDNVVQTVGDIASMDVPKDSKTNCEEKFPASTAKKRKLPAEDDTCESHLDYQAQYAEFAVPDLSPDLLQYITCEICKAKVPSDERSIQTHQDHHVALQLSQSLREEYRSTVKTNANPVPRPPNNVNKKSKKQATTTLAKKANNGVDIKRFLKPGGAEAKPPLSLEPSTSAAAEAQRNCQTYCAECKSHIADDEMEKHRDFHMAKELQRQLNLLQVRTVTIPRKVQPTPKARSSLNATQRVSASKSITEFFSQPNE